MSEERKPTFTPERYEEVIKALDWRAASYPPYWIASGIIAEWNRLCFLAPEPEVPEAVKDLLWKPKTHGTQLDSQLARYDEAHDIDILEAFRRGLKSAGVKAG
jgi:hypothetical protein